MSEPDYLICDDAVYIPGGEWLACSKCAARVYASPVSVAMIARDGLVVLCVRCADSQMRTDPDLKIGPLTDAQRAELRAAFRRF